MSEITAFRGDADRLAHPDDGILRDYRQRLADEERERAEQRRLQMADQRSDINGPQARIRAWETVHGLRLPTSPTHPVLRVIAAATELTLGDVLEEQRLRSGRSVRRG